MSIYDRVVEICKIEGLSIRQLEIKCGIGNGVIGKWKESSPSVENLQKVAGLLGVSIDYFLGRTGKDAKTDNTSSFMLLASHLLRDDPRLVDLIITCSKLEKEDFDIMTSLAKRLAK